MSSYRFVNRRYEEWFDLPKEEIIGKHIEEILGEIAYANIRNSAARALAGREVQFEQDLEYDVAANAG